MRHGPNCMQFSSRYDGRRLAARPPFSPARCFKSLVDWFDYAYAVLPAAVAWVRNPSFRMGATRAPSVIHLRGPFSRDVLHLTHRQGGNTSANVMNRPLARAVLFVALLAASYAVFAVTSGGPNLASAPSEETASVGAFSIQAAPGTVAEKISEVVSPQAEQSPPLATPVRTLQSAIEPQAAPAVTAAETSAEAAQPVPAPVVAVAPTAAPEVHTAIVPVATPAPVPPASPPARSSYYTAPETVSYTHLTLPTNREV